jgi:hypothetical protein
VRKRTRNGQPIVDKVRFQVGGGRRVDMVDMEARINNVWESVMKG